MQRAGNLLTATLQVALPIGTERSYAPGNERGQTLSDSLRATYSPWALMRACAVSRRRPAQV